MKEWVGTRKELTEEERWVGRRAGEGKDAADLFRL